MSEANKIRCEHQACLRLAKETDSKREERQLLQDAADLLKRLRSECTHEHTVTLRSPYEGSYSYDYDDRAPGERRCLCCGLYETGWELSDFRALVEPFARFEGRLPIEIERPLDYLLAECVDVAKSKGYRP